MTLKTKTIQGIGWAGTSRSIRILLQFGINIILARLLTPNDYGLLAMVVVFTSFVALFQDLGLSAALIQRSDISEEYLSSCFWVNVCFGFILTVLLAISAPFIAFFYNNNLLINIVKALSVTFLISSLGTIQSILFIKNLEFRLVALIEICSVSLSGLTAVLLAYHGLGVWSLVWKEILSGLLSLVFLWKLSSWKPKFIFKWDKVRELLGFGLNLTGFSFVNYFSRNFDNLLIGKLLGSIPLGFYNFAYQILLFPLSNISNIMGTVMYPSLSAIKDDKNKVKNTYINATKYISLITFPLMIGTSIVIQQLITVIFGFQWINSTFLVQILALVGLFQSVANPTGWIYMSQGRTDIMFKWGLVSAFVSATAFIVGIRWGIEGVAIAYSLSSLLLFYPCLAIPFKLIDLKFSYYIKQFTSIFFASVSMGLITLAVRIYLEDISGTSGIITLLFTVFTGVTSYSIILYVIDSRFCKQTFELLGELEFLNIYRSLIRKIKTSDKI